MRYYRVFSNILVHRFTADTIHMLFDNIETLLKGVNITQYAQHYDNNSYCVSLSHKTTDNCIALFANWMMLYTKTI